MLFPPASLYPESSPTSGGVFHKKFVQLLNVVLMLKDRVVFGDFGVLGFVVSVFFTFHLLIACLF